MASFNQCVIVGNATKDAEVRFINGSTAVCDIDIAVNESYFNKTTNQKVESVSFIPCTFFGKTAEIAGKYIVKGKSVLVSGRLKQETWTDKESGNKRSKLKLICDNMTLLGGLVGKSESRESSSEDTSGGSTFDDSGDVPF